MGVVNPTMRYTRLPGRGRRLSGRFFSGEAQRLYLGADHILVVRQTGYEETSKRFFLRDIQAITVQSNADRAILAGIHLMMMLVFVGFGLLLTQNDAEPIVAGIPYGIAGFFGVFVAIQLGMGASCTVRLHTAVQIEELTALRRFRVARKCLAILIPQVEAVQGGWPGRAVPPEILAMESVQASANATRSRASTPLKVLGSGVHAVAFALCVLFGLSSLAELLHQSTAKDIIDSIFLVAAVLLLLIAAIRQVNSTLPKQTRELIWAEFILNSVAFLVAVYLSIFIATVEGAASGEPPPMLATDMTSALVDRSPWLRVYTAVWGGLGLVLGVFGLMSVRGYSVVKPDAPEYSESTQP